MAKVIFDTNVLVDTFDENRPDHKTSKASIQLLLASDSSPCLAATSLKDLYYVLSRSLGEPDARAIIEIVSTVMTVLPVDENCCHHALSSSEPDFEDGIIRAAAEIAHADYLVTRDAQAFIGSTVPKISPTDLLRELTHKRKDAGRP
ncbi:MAG: PIN domain-containing protein [Propionibacteriaceae bacterium]|jgi:predicted nucleic acid-binding protein|nr:PIN domain-containing protein [Propionibacteriaceae bacterium]